jgi:ribonuclease VapC
MFVDASAIVAMITQEPEAPQFLDLVEAAAHPMTSAVAIFEAALGICRKRQSTVDEAYNDVRELLEEANIRVVDIGDAEAVEALSAFARYGKGRGHPARLNLGDCFAYAVAKTNGVPLLFKGDDFPKTDIATAQF